MLNCEVSDDHSDFKHARYKECVHGFMKIATEAC
jgi:hypothetical protein